MAQALLPAVPRIVSALAALVLSAVCRAGSGPDCSNAVRMHSIRSVEQCNSLLEFRAADGSL
jgi:hypothetical protein